jgi:hypothetical protein
MVLGLPAPVVVECKDHDDALPASARNVGQGWTSVERKLRAKAAADWPGAYAPWKDVRGYLYCISAVLTEQGRRELEGRIRTFFESLPAAGRPPIKARVLDWSDLRAWLDGFPSVADGWMGVGLERVVGHEELEARLSRPGFLSFLQDAQLPFVPPAQGAPFHPDRLLAKLRDRRGAGGVVLVGAGGVGKTRTALEVARRAHSAGWRVLHAVHPKLTNEELATAVLSAPGLTLVVIDYLEQMGALDLGDVRRVLLPQATEHGVELAFLGNSRPAQMQIPRADRDSLLERVVVDPDPVQRGAITQRMLDVAAPRACAAMGRQSVAQVCGVRPIIALIIAGELERRAQEGSLSPGDAGLRSGDLVPWLERRFAEDGLEVEPSSDFLTPSRPAPNLVAAAAAVAAAPQSFGAIVAAAEAAFRHSGVAGDAGYLVAALERMGWLESAGTQTVVAHDAVADELLKRVLLNGLAVRVEVLQAVLAAGFESPRTLGRLAVSLDRLSGNPAADRGEDALRSTAADWLRDRALELGALLAVGSADEGVYVLSTILRSSVWGDAALSSWDALAVPWLGRHEGTEEAGDLLYMSLRSVPLGEAGQVVEAALRWIGSPGRRTRASFVLGALLDRSDLGSDQAGDAIRLARAWLRSSRRRNSLHARFVLGGLLSRPELDGEGTAEASRAALGWLHYSDRGVTADATFVLRRLLKVVPAGRLEAADAIGRARTWLGHGKRKISSAASYIYPALLDRHDLSPDDAADAIRGALTWLRHGKRQVSPAASYIYPALLGRQDLAPGEAREVIEASAMWLRDDDRATSRHASFILSRLLARPDLPAETAEEVIGWTVAWLEAPGRLAGPDAGFMIPPLLHRSELSRSSGSRSVHIAQTWLHEPGAADVGSARRVLEALLGRPELSEAERTVIVERCRALLRAEGPGSAAGAAILKALLVRPMVSETEANELVADALTWLSTDDGWSRPEAHHLLHVLLGRPLRGEIRQTTADHALRWLRYHQQGASPQARVILPALLNRRDLDLWTTSEAIGHALTWLWQEDHAGTAPARAILQALLNRSDLAAGEAVEAISHALAWFRIKRNALAPEAAGVHRAVLERADLSADDAERAVGFALAWLCENENMVRPEAAHVLGALFARADLPAATLAWLLEVATHWLSVSALEPSSQYVLNRILQNAGVPDEDWCRAAELAVRWIVEHPGADVQKTVYLLIAVLARPGLLAPDQLRESSAASLRMLSAADEIHGRKRLSKRLKLAVKGSAPPSVPLGLAKATPPRPSAQHSPGLIQRLDAAAANPGARFDGVLMRHALAELTRRATVSPGSALFAVPSLLVLGARQGTTDADLVASHVAPIIADPRLTPKQCRALAFGCLGAARRMELKTVPRFCALVERVGIRMRDLLSHAAFGEYAALMQVALE